MTLISTRRCGAGPLAETSVRVIVAAWLESTLEEAASAQPETANRIATP